MPSQSLVVTHRTPRRRASAPRSSIHRSCILWGARIAVGLAIGAGDGGPCPASANALPSVRAHLKILPTDEGMPLTASSFSGFAFGLAALGAFGTDQRSTLAVGSHYLDNGATSRAGAISLLQLDPTGRVLTGHAIAPASGGFGAMLSADDYFGFAVAPIGDLDGDGIIDIAVGAPRDDDGGIDTGAVYILFLNEDGRVRSQRKISARRPWARRAPWTWILPRSVQGGLFAEVEDSENMGVGLAGLGDLDGDGIPDLAVGARAGGIEGAWRGAVWIFFLRRDGSIRDHRRIAPATAAPHLELLPEDEFGFGLATIGDLDGDGIPELAVGARGDDDGGPSHGAVWILFLDRDGSVRRSQKINGRHGGFGGRLNGGAEFGAAIAAVGDLDADGIPDIAVSARGDNAAGFNTGALWLLALERDGTVKSERRIGASEGGFTGKLARHDFFGAGLTALADLDGDGWPELAVGAEGDDAALDNAGSVWILFLGPPSR